MIRCVISLLCVLACGGISGGRGAFAAPTDAAGIEFFEKHVRPVLVESCYNCHSVGAEKGIKGGLALDTRDALLKGGDSGPSVVPGDPEKSLLIKAVRYHDENLQMPPKGKRLPEAQVEALVAWVKMGAPDPRTGQTNIVDPKLLAAKHWAFQPVREPAVPTVKNKKAVRTPVDNFLLARLEPKGLKLSPIADKRTLIRRATHDLTGLPPTAEEMAVFEADRSPDAFAKLVDRLLDSPRYGERWARYWLDIARYADTKGYVFEEERRYPYSYTYRDWVIRAFNEDLPYDQFLIQQIAADHLTLGEDKRPLAALGFLTLGRRFLNNQPDIIDDRIDVVTRGTMGLTVACARCHDHKFDPVPTKDYYSLYGVFASSHEPTEQPLLGAAAMPPEYPQYLEERKKREDELANYRQTKFDEALVKVRGQVGDYLLVVHDAAAVEDDKREALVRERKLQPTLYRHYRRAVKDWDKPGHALLAPWFELAAIGSSNFAERASSVIAGLKSRSGSNAVNRLIAARLAEEPALKSLKDVAGRYNKLFAEIDADWRAAVTNQPAVKALADADREAFRQLLYADGTPIRQLDSGDLRGFTDTPVQQKLRALKRKVDELDATHAGAPPRAMALLDNATPTEPVVFKRGNPGNHGDKVPRQFLEVLAGPERKPFTKGSGRLEMARAIASRDNPLTARVFVNRVWAYHFVNPLVRTPSDFGVRTEPPTHPELLDFLAARFMTGGWSVKALHRMILLSAAYQQSSENNAKADAIDPGNELLWRMNRRRLDFEAMRDTLLAVSGKLDLALGGHAVDITTEPFATRRTVYGFVERQNLPGLFRTFDFASPDATSPQRFSTTVPQQALFLMNSPFVVEQARALLTRPEVKTAGTDEQKLRVLHQIAFQRTPEADELKLAASFIAGQTEASAEPEPPAWSYGYGRYDEAARRVEGFTTLPHWTGYAWQGGKDLPDAKIGWVLLSAEGGHVGNDANHAAIRRWRAPRDGVVNIAGTLDHPSDKGDGVRARIVSSRTGLLGEWTTRHGKTPVELTRVEVRRGDTLDFVADCRESVAFDSFHWVPMLRFTAPVRKPTADDVPSQWNAREDFSGPQRAPEKRALTPWEKYAQVLLLANELMFVD